MAKVLTLGAIADQIHDKKAAKAALDLQSAALKAEIDLLEVSAFAAMDAQGTTKAEGKKCSLSISSRVIANVTEWDDLWPWVAKTKSFYMIQKRVNDTTYREMLELGKKIPGVQPFTKRALSVRST